MDRIGFDIMGWGKMQWCAPMRVRNVRVGSVSAVRWKVISSGYTRCSLTLLVTSVVRCYVCASVVDSPVTTTHICWLTQNTNIPQTRIPSVDCASVSSLLPINEVPHLPTFVEEMHRSLLLLLFRPSEHSSRC